MENEDEALFSVSAEPSEIAEGGSATVTVAISNDARFVDEQMIVLAVSGRASSPDYELAPSLTLAAGSSSAMATLTATDDAEEEQAETAMVTANVAGVEVGFATVTIAANDSDDATLGIPILSDVDIGTFDSETTVYPAEVDHDVAATAVEATPSDAGASVMIADAAGSTSGRQRTSSLSVGENEINRNSDGDWRLLLSSDLDIDVLAYYPHARRFPDVDARRGTGVVGRTARGDLQPRQQSQPGEPAAAGQPGDDGRGGDDHRRRKCRRLAVTSKQPVIVMSLLSRPTGHLTNLSTAPDQDGT